MVDRVVEPTEMETSEQLCGFRRDSSCISQVFVLNKTRDKIMLTIMVTYLAFICL